MQLDFNEVMDQLEKSEKIRRDQKDIIKDQKNIICKYKKKIEKYRALVKKSQDSSDIIHVKIDTKKVKKVKSDS